MLTILFYNFILLSSTFFVWLSEKGKTGFDRRVLLGIAFLLVFIPSAIRYDIGTDYLSYLNIFNTPSFLENYKFKEPSFYYINWFLYTNGFHFQWMFATFAFIFTTIAFIAYPRKNAWLLHFLFFSSLWFFSFNGMRQAIAISWSLLALCYFFKKKYLSFSILIIIGASFHQSIILILPIGLLALIPLKNSVKVYVIPFIFTAIIILTYFSMNTIFILIENILNFLGLTRYANYFTNTKHFIPKDFGSGLGVLTNILFSIYIIFNIKSFIIINKNYWLIIILIFIYAVGMVLASSIVIFERMSVTFSIAPILGAFLLPQLPRNKQLNRIVLFIFVIFLSLSFLKSSLGTPTSYGDPKRTPYQTIFSEKI